MVLDKTISLTRKPTKILAKANKNKGKLIFKEDSSTPIKVTLLVLVFVVYGSLPPRVGTQRERELSW